jgi:hypothetical protein
MLSSCFLGERRFEENHQKQSGKRCGRGHWIQHAPAEKALLGPSLPASSVTSVLASPASWLRLRSQDRLFLEQLAFLLHAQHEIFCPAARRDDAVGQGLLDFRCRCACLLRDREVFAQSVRTANRHGAGDSDQLAGAQIQHLFVLEIKNLLAYFHRSPPGKKGESDPPATGSTERAEVFGDPRCDGDFER